MSQTMRNLEFPSHKSFKLALLWHPYRNTTKPLEDNKNSLNLKIKLRTISQPLITVVIHLTLRIALEIASVNKRTKRLSEEHLLIMMNLFPFQIYGNRKLPKINSKSKVSKSIR
jgi:hypothetical protein